VEIPGDEDDPVQRLRHPLLLRIGEFQAGKPRRFPHHVRRDPLHRAVLPPRPQHAGHQGGGEGRPREIAKKRAPPLVARTVLCLASAALL
jgi:hypothetical protein